METIGSVVGKVLKGPTPSPLGALVLALHLRHKCPSRVWGCFVHYGGVAAHSTDCRLLKRKAKRSSDQRGQQKRHAQTHAHTLIGARQRVSPTEASARNPPNIYFSCKRGCGIPFAIKTAFLFFCPLLVPLHPISPFCFHLFVSFPHLKSIIFQPRRCSAGFETVILC